MLRMPTTGNRASGTKAVAAMGMASVAHQHAIIKAREASSQAERSRVSGTGRNCSPTASTNPVINPMR